MKTFASNLLVWVGDTTACIKITGRASFTCSVDFKDLINGLAKKGFGRFVLDLTDCLLMDSTFLGVLVGLGQTFAAARNGDTHAIIDLLNPSPRILDLVENLGASKLFKVLNCSDLELDKMASLERTPANPDRKEISRTCLEAHQILMGLNPANLAKFKDVAQFLAEDLKKMEDRDGNPS